MEEAFECRKITFDCRNWVITYIRGISQASLEGDLTLSLIINFIMFLRVWFRLLLCISL